MESRYDLPTSSPGVHALLWRLRNWVLRLTIRIDGKERLGVELGGRRERE
jgi:hypothetical protein